MHKCYRECKASLRNGIKLVVRSVVHYGVVPCRLASPRIDYFLEDVPRVIMVNTRLSASVEKV